jgi:hypothetical protein
MKKGYAMKMYFSQSSRVNRTLSEKEIERNALLSDLEKTKKALEIAYSGFDNVTEPDLIDCYIYEVNSVLKRYKFLLEQAAALSLLPEEDTHSAPLGTETPLTPLVG